jgi:hypothetical protein
MRFFKEHPEASKKNLSLQFQDYLVNSGHPGHKTIMAYNSSKKKSSKEIIEILNKKQTRNPYEIYGYLRELKDRKKLSLRWQQKLDKLENIPKDLKKYDKAPTPAEAIGTPALVAGGMGLGMMGLQKSFYTSEEKVRSVLEGMGKKHGLEIGTNKEKLLTIVKPKDLGKYHKGAKAIAAKSVDLHISKDYGKIIPMIFGHNPGPHYAGSDILGKAIKNPSIATTPNVGIAAHEMGHAINQEKFLKSVPKIKRAYNLAYMQLPLGPIKNVPLLAIPAVAAALYAGKKRAEGKDAKFIPEFVEKHPEILIGAGAAPMLFEEGAASARALKGISQHYKGARRVKELGKAVATLLPAYGTYAIAAALPIIGIKAYQKHIKAKKDLEKKYKHKKSLGERLTELHSTMG